MALVPGDLDVEKGINTSKCREVAYGCSIRPEKALTNDGFRIGFSVVTTGFLPDHDFVRGVSRKLQKYLAALLNDQISEESLNAVIPDLFDLPDFSHLSNVKDF